MLNKCLLLCITILFNFSVVWGQESGKIKFIESISIEEALTLANAQGKNIFIDTYANWCIPCRKLEKNMHDKEVADFYNEKFINVRINMDSDPHAQSYKEFLGVIFLPTIAIVNHTGYIRFKADRVLSKEDLLSVAKKAQNPNTHIYSMATGVESDPLSNYGQTILHVIGDDNSKLPPDLIRQEAYFRLELMDGSHIAAAQQYLATQSDWSAESNLRFILDFVSNVSSKEWEYLLTHRKEFDTVIGKDQVDRTIQIIVYNQLYQGYPRPTLEEAINYYSLIDAVKCTQWGHIYILNRYLDECQSQNYIEVANYYLSKLNTNDHYVMYNLANFLYQDNLNEKAGVWIDEAVKLKPDDIDYLILAAEIYSLTPQKEKSIKYIDKALELSQKENRNQDYLIFLKNNIIGQKSNK